MRVIWTEDWKEPTSTETIKPTRFRMVSVGRGGGAYALEREITDARGGTGWQTMLAFKVGDVDKNAFVQAGITPTMLVGMLDVINGHRTR